jgi:glycosyltransferase involved in cell wall biosynthesis
LQRALDSVFEQTHKPVELIVIDGASTDGTQAIIEANAARIAYWTSEPDRTVYEAWNKALGHVTGDWISFLGSDDRYQAQDVLARIARVLARDEERHLVAYGYLNKVRMDGAVVRSTVGPWTPAQRRRFLRGVMIPHPATFHHRKLFERHGRFDERFRIAGDYEFLLRELLEHDPLFMPELVVEMAGGGMSDRRSNVYRMQREVYVARYMHGLERTPPWRSFRLLRKLLRVWIARHLGPRAAKQIGHTYRSISQPRRQDGPGPGPHGQPEAKAMRSRPTSGKGAPTDSVRAGRRSAN